MPHETTKQKRKNYQEIRFLKFLRDLPSPDYGAFLAQNGVEYSNTANDSNAFSREKKNYHILRFIRATFFQNELWLATEFLQGGTLAQVYTPTFFFFRLYFA